MTAVLRITNGSMGCSDERVSGTRSEQRRVREVVAHPSENSFTHTAHSALSNSKMRRVGMRRYMTDLTSIDVTRLELALTRSDPAWSFSIASRMSNVTMAI